VDVGMQVAFGQRHVQAARQDLVRICAEIREEFDPIEHPHSKPVGAIYISCAGRGGPHFGAPNAEMEIIAHALGDVPLVGMFAGGEIEMKAPISGRRISNCMPIQAPKLKPATQQCLAFWFIVCR